ncbi:Uracil-DNA glycosylase-like [Trinorchestia longiramus]|nr:Uracil-DNA glycosylase-like [Trinorchestia longiramus]
MTGVEAADERLERRSYPESCSPLSCSARSSPDTSSTLQPLLTSSNSNTSSSPPPYLLEPLTPSTTHSSFTPLTEPASPGAPVKTESLSHDDDDTTQPESNWSMHLDVLSKLKTESEDWYDNEELSPEALLNSSRNHKSEYANLSSSYPSYSNSPPPMPSSDSYQPFHEVHPFHYASHPVYSPYFHPDYTHHIAAPPPIPHPTYSPPPHLPPQSPHPAPSYPLPHTPPTTPHPSLAPPTPPTPPHPPNNSHSPIILPKRRGRKPKHVKIEEDNGNLEAVAAAWAEHDAKKRRKTGAPPAPAVLAPPAPPPDPPAKPRKKMDRFGGLEEEEVAKKTLPDHLKHGLDIVIIGINPGLFAAYKGHHYAGPGNHFWKCLYLSGLIPEPLGADDDGTLLKFGIGFTNIVARTTRGSAELTRLEIKQGGELLVSKLRFFRPRIAVFNGKGIYEIFSGKKDFQFGKQPEMFPHTDTYVWVMPSSSARCAQLPRALDKVPFYSALRKFRDYLNGTVDHITEEEMTFAHVKLKNFKKEDKVVIEESEEEDEDTADGEVRVPESVESPQQPTFLSAPEQY